MVKQFLALLCALVLQASSAQEPQIVDKHEDWIVADINPRVVTMYKNITAIGPAQFNVEMQSIFKPGSVVVGPITVGMLHGVLNVNCLKRTTKVVQDQSYSDKGERIPALENKFSEKDTDTTPRSGAQGTILNDLCGSSEIEWSDT